MRFGLRRAIFKPTPGGQPVNQFGIIEKGDEITTLKVDEAVEALSFKNGFNKGAWSLIIFNELRALFKEKTMFNG